LKTDFVDILMVHRFDPITPVDETLETLGVLVKDGKVRYLAASTMRPTQFARLQFGARSLGMQPFIAMQNLYNLINRDDEQDLIPFCREEGVSLIPYSPLARGVLAGRSKVNEGVTERAKNDELAAQYKGQRVTTIVDQVLQVSTDLGVKTTQVALAWLLSRDSVVAPVVGVTNIAQLDDAIAAVQLKIPTVHLDRLSR